MEPNCWGHTKSIDAAYNIDANRIYCTTFIYTPTVQRLYVNGEFQSSSDTTGGADGAFDDTFWAIFYNRAVPGGNGAYADGEFYLGRRSDDDERQIDRWKKLAGPKGRFRKWLVTQILKKGTKKDWNDHSISPAIRQTLQHWAYKLKKKDFDKEVKSR